MEAEISQNGANAGKTIVCGTEDGSNALEDGQSSGGTEASYNGGNDIRDTFYAFLYI